MNTRIYVEKPKWEKPQVELGDQGGSLCQNQQNGTRHATQFTHTFYELNLKALLKKDSETLLHSNTLYHSRENK